MAISCHECRLEKETKYCAYGADATTDESFESTNLPTPDRNMFQNLINNFSSNMLKKERKF